MAVEGRDGEGEEEVSIVGMGRGGVLWCWCWRWCWVSGVVEAWDRVSGIDMPYTVNSTTTASLNSAHVLYISSFQFLFSAQSSCSLFFSGAGINKKSPPRQQPRISQICNSWHQPLYGNGLSLRSKPPGYYVPRTRGLMLAVNQGPCIAPSDPPPRHVYR